MLLRTERVLNPETHRYSDILYLRCDTCGKEWSKRGNKKVYQARRTHVCSPDCHRISNRAGGAAHTLYTERMQQKYGCDNAFQASDVKDQIKETMLEHYGVENPSQSSQVQERMQATWLSKYGVEHPFMLESTKEKSRLATTSSEARARRRKTCLDRYGGETPFHSPAVQKKARLSSSKPESIAKRHETMRRKGVFGRSGIEDRFYEYLCFQFGAENVDRQVGVCRWPIDFYLRRQDVYIQLDGVYWHGLDRSVDVIKEFRSPRDRVIYRKMLTDEAQNEYFKQHNMTLIRVTDKEYIAEVEKSDFGFASRMGKLKMIE